VDYRPDGYDSRTDEKDAGEYRVAYWSIDDVGGEEEMRRGMAHKWLVLYYHGPKPKTIVVRGIPVTPSEDGLNIANFLSTSETGVFRAFRESIKFGDIEKGSRIKYIGYMDSDGGGYGRTIRK
jgi:hypothetical protein